MSRVEAEEDTDKGRSPDRDRDNARIDRDFELTNIGIGNRAANADDKPDDAARDA